MDKHPLSYSIQIYTQRFEQINALELENASQKTFIKNTYFQNLTDPLSLIFFYL